VFDILYEYDVVYTVNFTISTARASLDASELLTE